MQTLKITPANNTLDEDKLMQRLSYFTSAGLVAPSCKQSNSHSCIFIHIICHFKKKKRLFVIVVRLHFYWLFYNTGRSEYNFKNVSVRYFSVVFT